jgi:argininosuccinate lyase
VLQLFAEVVDGIVVAPARALHEVDAEYSTTTEIADALLQKAEVPFRIGHHFASHLADYGRAQRLRLRDIPFAEVQRIYSDETKQLLPLSESEFAQAISAQYMVFGRRGSGGPQLEEVDRMLADAAARAAADRAWHDGKLGQLAAAQHLLEQKFSALAAA